VTQARPGRTPSRTDPSAPGAAAPPDHPAEQPSEHRAGQPAERPAKQPAESPAEQPPEHPGTPAPHPSTEGDMSPGSPRADIPTLATLLARIRSTPAHLGHTRLILVDGPAGSGKTTLAAALAAALHHPPVIHMDDLYLGWSGLDAGIDRLRDEVLRPLADHRPAAYRRYDWFSGELAETVQVPAADHLIVEGCGSAARRTAGSASTVLWVETDDAERLARGLARDGDDARPHWLRWMTAERAHYTAERTRERADLRLDGHGHLLP